MPGARKYLTKYLHRKSYILQEIFVVLTYTHGMPCTVFNILFIQKRFASRDYTRSFIFDLHKKFTFLDFAAIERKIFTCITGNSILLATC